MHKILVVDDERSILDLLEMILKKEQFQVATASDGKSAMALFDSFKPDLVLLDLMLPDINGHDLCREMTKKRRVPIIMLTAKNDIVDKVLGLELGADDYITKPFDTRELVARIKAVLRRLKKNEADDRKILSHLDLVVDLENRTVTKGGKPIELTLKEYELLELLIKNPGRCSDGGTSPAGLGLRLHGRYQGCRCLCYTIKEKLRMTAAIQNTF